MQAKYEIDQSLTGAERTKARKRAAYLANMEARLESARIYRCENKESISSRRRASYAQNPEKSKAYNAAYISTRREEAAARSAAWRAADPSRAVASKKLSYEKHRERTLEKQARWATENKDKIRAYQKRRYAEKYELYVAAANARRARKLMATAAWDLELTELATTEAAHLTRIRRKATGISWHADHIVPLRGKTVSGLHVWNNLAVIPAIINLKKGNRHEQPALP